MEYSFLESSGELVPARVRQLAVERNLHGDDRWDPSPSSIRRIIHCKVGAPEITGFSANRPNVVGNPNSGPRTPQEWFNVSAFQQLAPDPLGRFQVFGNEGRNVVAGPGYVNWDFSVFKNIKVSESKDIQFRGELFNLLNHTNFRLPVSDISSPNFGQIQTDVSPRVIQVALKFLF